MKSCWEILGIDAITDTKEIKKAFSALIYHPEDDPSGFQELQEAYQLPYDLFDSIGSNKCLVVFIST